VLQGNNLRSLLFNLFVNDLHERNRSRENSVTLNSTEFSCLLYADDLVLLASNPKSLQHNINILNNYCNEWHLKVNLKKTKIVTFSNSGRKCKHLFQYDDSVIENASNYNYLGIKLTSSGTFTYGQKELVSKARKAAFRISKNLNHPFCGVNLMMKLFDALILYGSEIWGNNYITETFHNRFFKSVLGLSRNASNSATLGDLGRLFIDIAILKFWLHIVNDKCRQLVKETYISEVKQNSNWTAYIRNLLCKTGLLYICQNPSAI
jgi:hypothetical protein